jgi:hypothetical protein
MSKPLPFSRATPYRLDTLHAALQAAGIAVETIYAVNTAHTDIRVVVGNTQAEAPVAAVVNAHDATARPDWELGFEADQGDLADFRDNWLVSAQLLGYTAATNTWAPAGSQWDSLTPAQRTRFWQRLFRLLRVLVRRQGA